MAEQFLFLELPLPDTSRPRGPMVDYRLAGPSDFSIGVSEPLEEYTISVASRQQLLEIGARGNELDYLAGNPTSELPLEMHLSDTEFDRLTSTFEESPDPLSR